jgi:glycosyltransferase involved in cell wall biosynthesis
MSSVLSQALPAGWDLEWIVQEDGPSPSLDAVLPEEDSRIKYSANGSALSIGMTRNLALTRAAGELIQVLDHDDVILPGAFEALIPAFSDMQIHWAIGQADDLLSDGTREDWPSALPLGRITAGTVNKWAVQHEGNWPIHCAGLMMRTSTVRAIGGWAGFPYDDDVIMFACLSEIADGYNEPKTTWLYRQHENQVTKSDSRREWSETARKLAVQRGASVRASGLALDSTYARAASAAVHSVEVGMARKFRPEH